MNKYQVIIDDFKYEIKQMTGRKEYLSCKRLDADTHGEEDFFDRRIKQEEKRIAIYQQAIALLEKEGGE